MSRRSFRLRVMRSRFGRTWKNAPWTKNNLRSKRRGKALCPFLRSHPPNRCNLQFRTYPRRVSRPCRSGPPSVPRWKRTSLSGCSWPRPSREPGALRGAEILCPESAHAVLSVSKNLELLKQRLSELCGLAVPLTLRKAEAQTRHSLLEQNRQSRQQAAKDLRKEWEQDPLVLEIRKVFGGGKVRGVPKLDS